jgi:hypothetical protein
MAYVGVNVGVAEIAGVGEGVVDGVLLAGESGWSRVGVDCSCVFMVRVAVERLFVAIYVMEGELISGTWLVTT